MTRAERERVGRLLMAHRRAVMRWLFAGGVYREDAPDAAQEVFTQAIARWGDFRPGEPLSAWLRGITRRVASNWRRVRRRRPVVLVDEPAMLGSHVTLDAHLEARAELRALPEHLRPLLLALLDDGCMIAPAARALNVDQDSLRVRLVSIRRGLPVEPLVSRKKRRAKNP